MRSTWHFRPDEESVESLYRARLIPPKLRLTRRQLRSMSEGEKFSFDKDIIFLRSGYTSLRPCIFLLSLLKHMNV